jgi:hypothetical protein
MKPTPPGVRFCGSYDVPDKHIIYQQHYIPHVLTELTKAAKASYFHDLDMTHAFHQIKLDKVTRQILAVLTPWGMGGGRTRIYARGNKLGFRYFKHYND